MQHLRINVLHNVCDVSSRRHYATVENQRLTHFCDVSPRDIMQHLRINALQIICGVSSRRHYATLEIQRFTH